MKYRPSIPVCIAALAIATGLVGCALETDAALDEQAIITAKAIADQAAPYRYPNVGRVRTPYTEGSGTILNEVAVLTAAHAVVSFNGNTASVATPREVAFDYLPDGSTTTGIHGYQFAISAIHVPREYYEHGIPDQAYDLAILIVDPVRSGKRTFPLHGVRSHDIRGVAGFSVTLPNVHLEEAGFGVGERGLAVTGRHYGRADFVGVVEYEQGSGVYDMIETLPIACSGDSGGPLFATFCPAGGGGILPNCTPASPGAYTYQVGVASYLNDPYRGAPCGISNARFASTAWNGAFIDQVLASYGRGPDAVYPPGCTEETCCDNGVRPLETICDAGKAWLCINPSGTSAAPNPGEEGPLSSSQWLPAGDC